MCNVVRSCSQGGENSGVRNGGAMVAKGCAAEDCCNGGIMYNNGPVTASSFSFQKRTAVPIKEAVAAFLLYFQSPLAVFLDFNSFPNILRPEFPLCSTHAYGILCGQRQSLAKAAPAKDLSFLDTQIQPAKSHFARQNHTAVVTTKTMYYYSCFFRRYPVK